MVILCWTDDGLIHDVGDSAKQHVYKWMHRSFFLLFFSTCHSLLRRCNSRQKPTESSACDWLCTILLRGRFMIEKSAVAIFPWRLVHQFFSVNPVFDSCVPTQTSLLLQTSISLWLTSVCYLPMTVGTPIFQCKSCVWLMCADTD